MEIDYAQQEVRVGACYHKDPMMIEYIENPAKDMHRDMAVEIFKLDVGDVSKEIRYAAKNKFVFPQFYGDWYVSCAKSMWDSAANLSTPLELPLKKHLKQQGIRSYQAFEDHVEEIERQFWKERFSGYDQWKEDWYDQYMERGWFKMLTGFECHGVFDRKKVINYPVQGAAFHCLLWSLVVLQEWLGKLGLKSLIVGQIHDSIVMDVVPEEEAEVKALAKKVMTESIAKEWEWLIVPLEVEFETADVDASWHELKEEEG